MFTFTQAAHVAADFLKLNFPAAFSASLLAWGLIEFRDVSTSTLVLNSIRPWTHLAYTCVLLCPLHTPPPCLSLVAYID